MVSSMVVRGASEVSPRSSSRFWAQGVLLAVTPSFSCCTHPGASVSGPLPGDGSSDTDVDSGAEDTGIADGDTGRDGTGDDRDPVWSADEAAEHYAWILSQGFPTPTALWVHIEALVANGGSPTG
jgi:hypothetical protein